MLPERKAGRQEAQKYKTIRRISKMIDNTLRSALVTLIKSRRQKMSRAERQRGIKLQRWLYPYATEVRYAATIRAWFRPMRDYVHSYLKENQEAILRGDSDTFRADSLSVARLDAVPGKSFKTIIDFLNGWTGQYVPDDDESKSGSPIYMGLGRIADSTFDFNEGQYEKGAKAALGVEFPVGEDWWPVARDTWAAQNYKLIKGDMEKYIGQINALTEKAVTSGLSVKELAKQIAALDDKLKGRANFIARDQIGKLNGEITQRRMEDVGLSMYIWETSGDERVRPSHEMIDGALCRWDDSAVYSQDGGKTWIPRPSGAVLLHPGIDYLCRCTAIAEWNELVGEADALIAQYEELDALSAQNIAAMSKNTPLPPPSSQQKQEAQEQRRRKRNARKTNEAVKKAFPNEKWVSADALKFKYKGEDFDLPAGIDLIYVAQSRLTGLKDDERVLAKEIRQGGILEEKGNSVYLLPKLRAPNGSFISGPDAIVNGQLFEFKTVTGTIDKVERRFRESRSQGQNVYIRVTNPSITRNNVIKKLIGVVNDPKYTGGFQGHLVFTVGQGKSERTYFINIKDLKR
jgi:SPP1 gp7 family putative phage head morphogenesis protein